jgi:hypothetical protein
MTIAAMKITGTAPSGFAGAARLAGAGSATPRSTWDSASAVISSTTLESTNGSRASCLTSTTPR